MVTVAIRALELGCLDKILIEVGFGVGTFLPTPTPPKIPSDSDSDSTALNSSTDPCISSISRA
jgi:hypothetical protein